MFVKNGSPSVTVNVCKYCPDVAKKCYSLTSSTETLFHHVKTQHPLDMKNSQPLVTASKKCSRYSSVKRSTTADLVTIAFEVDNLELPLVYAHRVP
ncbi:hypothetical protein RCL1_002854 [Eukaryota sp. TZLM3-RCL]